MKNYWLNKKKILPTIRTAKYKSYDIMLENDDLYHKFKEFTQKIYNQLNQEKIHFLNWLENLARYGDLFVHLKNKQAIPEQYMFRIETIKGETLEFQYSTTGHPNYQAISFPFQNYYTEKGNTIERFKPNDIMHLRLTPDKLYPYGTSVIEKGVLNTDMKYEIYSQMKILLNEISN